MEIWFLRREVQDHEVALVSPVLTSCEADESIGHMAISKLAVGFRDALARVPDGTSFVELAMNPAREGISPDFDLDSAWNHFVDQGAQMGQDPMLHRSSVSPWRKK